MTSEDISNTDIKKLENVMWNTLTTAGRVKVFKNTDIKNVKM
jgi:hypothetical protein